MAGGPHAALQTSSAEIDALNLPAAQGAIVFDLGAGFGIHSIPLVHKGARVTAIDTSAELLHTLDVLRGGLPIRTINDDLLSFQDRMTEAHSAILCMGDTVTHLPVHGAVAGLIEKAAAALPPGGTLVLSFLDYTVPLIEDQRFIAVRNSESRIITYLLRYEPEFVIVHDILLERTPDDWQTRISHYRKLGLPPEHLIASCSRTDSKSAKRLD